jgi:cysteine desulfurase
MRRPILLDANASAPTLPVARAALFAALDVVDGANPSAPHGPGRAARRLLDEARDRVAAATASATKDVFFTSGASESNRLIVDMMVEHGRRTRPPVVVTSPLEHPSLARPLTAAATRGAVALRTLPVLDDDVAIDGPDIDVILADADVVVVTAAHNETGLLPRVDALAARLREEVILVVDAAQSLGRCGPPPARADVVVASAHKLGGVAGAGALVLRRRARVWPTPWVGGGQENGLRPGTEATALHAAFGAACAVVDTTRAAHAALVAQRDRLAAALAAAARGRVLCAARPRLPNTAAVLFPDVDADALRMLLDQAGVAVGFGAACSALSPEPSPALRALGLSADDARRVVRVSLAPGIEDDAIDDAIARIADVAVRLRRRGADGPHG